MVEETTFYSDDEGVRITNTRAIFGSTTYAMNNVTSVSKGYKSANHATGVLMIVIGIVVAWLCITLKAVLSGIVAGVIFVAIGVLLLKILKPTYSVKIGSASGEIVALESQNGKYIQDIVEAMNEAIMKRG